VLCSVSGLNESSYYYQPHPREDTILRAAIEAIAVVYPFYGYRRMTAQLRREGFRANRKRVLRLMREGCLLVQIRRWVRTSIYRPGLGNWPNRLKGREVEHPNEVWVADITYIRLRESFVFLAVLMDIYTRSMRGWSVQTTLEATLVEEALESAFSKHPAPKIHHSDHGIQYLSKGYVDRLEAKGVQISLSSVGRPTENGFCERVMRTIKEEEVYINEYENIDDLRERMDYFLKEVYNRKRIHSALGYQTPEEYEAVSQAKKSQEETEEKGAGQPKKRTTNPKTRRRPRSEVN
jgi:putative transposase